jgi:hypothetical protein
LLRAMPSANSGLQDVVRVQHVLAHHPARLAHADLGRRFDQVGVFEARRVALEQIRQRVGLPPPLSLRRHHIQWIGRIALDHARGVEKGIREAPLIPLEARRAN